MATGWRVACEDQVSNQGEGWWLGPGGWQGGSEKNRWRVLFVWGTFCFFSFIFLVEVLKVELTGLTDRTHSGSVLHMVQAMISEKSRGGGSTQNDLLVLVLKSEFLAAPEKQRKMWQLWAHTARGDDKRRTPEGGEGSRRPH